MANKYEWDGCVKLILNCKRATEFVEKNKTRLPSEADFFRLYQILSEDILDVTVYGTYRTFLSSIKIRRLFEKRVHGGMSEAEIIKLIKSIFKARPFTMYSAAVCKLLMDWLYGYHNLKPNYDLEEYYFGKFLNKLL